MLSLSLHVRREKGRVGAEGVEKSKCFWRLSGGGGREVNQLTTRREERKGHDAVSYGTPRRRWIGVGSKDSKWH